MAQAVISSKNKKINKKHKFDGPRKEDMSTNELEATALLFKLHGARRAHVYVAYRRRRCGQLTQSSAPSPSFTYPPQFHSSVLGWGSPQTLTSAFVVSTVVVLKLHYGVLVQMALKHCVMLVAFVLRKENSCFSKMRKAI